MPRPLISEFLNHSQLSGASECDVTFEQYHMYRLQIKAKLFLLARSPLTRKELLGNVCLHNMGTHGNIRWGNLIFIA